MVLKVSMLKMRADKVIVTVKKVKGHCRAGHKVGDKIVFIGDNIIESDSFCPLGIAAIFPILRTMATSGNLPPSSPFYVDKNTWIGCCPDPNNSVVYEMKRVGVYERRPDTKGKFVPVEETKLGQTK